MPKLVSKVCYNFITVYGGPKQKLHGLSGLNCTTKTVVLPLEEELEDRKRWFFKPNHQSFSSQWLTGMVTWWPAFLMNRALTDGLGILQTFQCFDLRTVTCYDI